jgi:hypothetical protein
MNASEACRLSSVIIAERRAISRKTNRLRAPIENIFQKGKDRFR